MHESDFKVEISFESLTMAERISKGRSVMFVKRTASSLHNAAARFTFKLIA